jgi:hypothetical protein
MVFPVRVGKKLQKFAGDPLMQNPGIERLISLDINLDFFSFLVLLFIGPELNIERCGWVI